MMYKNSLKLIFSNFSLVWKLLIYFLIGASICGVISYFLSGLVSNNLGITETISQIPEMIKRIPETFDLRTFFINLREVLINCLTIIINNFQNIWYWAILYVVLFMLVPSVIFDFYLMSTCNVLHFYMGSCVNFAFTASIFMNFKKNFRYQLASVITLFPLKILTYAIVVNSFVLLKFSGILGFFAPFIIVSIFVLLTAFRISIFSGWVPYIVIKNTGVMSGLCNGIRYIRKRLAKIFASSIGLVLTIIVISILGMFTYGVSLIITIPASFLFIATFNMVAYYTSSGLRFYVDNNNVYAPKKSEMVESYKIYKNII